MDTARACMHRRRILSASLHDARGEAEAHRALGAIEKEAGDLEQADRHFARALHIAAEQGEQRAVNQSKMEIGLCQASRASAPARSQRPHLPVPWQGAARFEEWMASVA